MLDNQSCQAVHALCVFSEISASVFLINFQHPITIGMLPCLTCSFHKTPHVEVEAKSTPISMVYNCLQNTIHGVSSCMNKIPAPNGTLWQSVVNLISHLRVTYINFSFYPYTLMSALYTQCLPEFCKKKNHRHITRVGFEPMTFAIVIWYSTLVSHK